jgi:hypothetical protein
MAAIFPGEFDHRRAPSAGNAAVSSDPTRSYKAAKIALLSILKGGNLQILLESDFQPASDSY